MLSPLQLVWFKITAFTSAASFKMAADSTWLSFGTRTLDATICYERSLAAQKLLCLRIHAKRACKNKRDIHQYQDV